MALEDLTGSSKFIDALDQVNPDGATDQKHQGDDHIRGIKNVLKNSFPNITGAVTATHGQLNKTTLLANITALSSTDDVLDNFPAGTLMLFQQTAAPTGWTKQVTHNDKALRVVSGTAASGGATSFVGVFGSGKNTGSTALSISQMPAHDHGGGNHLHNLYADTGAPYLMNLNDDGPMSSSGTYRGTTGYSGNVISSQGSGAGHTHTLSLDLQYVDIIIASKN